MQKQAVPPEVISVAHKPTCGAKPSHNTRRARFALLSSTRHFPWRFLLKEDKNQDKQFQNENIPRHYISTKPLICSTHHEGNWEPTETRLGQKCSPASAFQLMAQTRFDLSPCGIRTLNIAPPFPKVWKWRPPGTVAFSSCVKNGRGTKRKRGEIWGRFYGRRWPPRSEREKTHR